MNPVSYLRPAIVLITLFTLLTGIVLPLGFTGAATAVAPGLANGLLVQWGGVVVGSALLGQTFTSPRYFQGRLSATTDTDPNDATKTVPAPYNAANSGASNLGPTSKALLDRVKGDIAGLGGPDAQRTVPGDMVTSSASGLDPDISPANAERQVARVAAAREMSEARLRAMIAEHTEGRLFGLIGEPRVNVLSLNLALEPVPAVVNPSGAQNSVTR